MKDFELVKAEARLDGTMQVWFRARLGFEEYLALGKLRQLPPYPDNSSLDVWLDAPMPLSATRLDGYDAPTRDIAADTEQHLYEVRALTRLTPPDSEAIRAALERELSGVRKT
jgi:hypothetical protein